MRPLPGVAAEILVLAVLLALTRYVPPGAPLALFILVAQAAATYLIHCPAHYVVGRLAGIRFTKMRVGRTTLARALPARAATLAMLLPVLTLSVEKGTLANVSGRHAASMYLAGVVASVLSAFAIAVVSTFIEPSLYSALAWVFAFAYLVFDAVFSPRSGDWMRARSAAGSAPSREPRAAAPRRSLTEQAPDFRTLSFRICLAGGTQRRMGVRLPAPSPQGLRRERWRT